MLSEDSMRTKMSCVMKKQLFDEEKKESNRNKCDRWDVFLLLEAETFCLFTALWRGWWSRGGQSCAWCLLQHYSRLTTINCRFIRLLVILSVFLLSCKASSPLTELRIVHTHPWLYAAMIYSSLESKIPLARILKQVYVTVCIWQIQFQRETLCIGSAVSHKCVLAFITSVDLGEWMLWRDCDNSALSIFWILSKKTCWLPVEAWRSFKCGVRCLYLLLLDVHCDQCKRWFCFVFLRLCQQVKHNSFTIWISF